MTDPDDTEFITHFATAANDAEQRGDHAAQVHAIANAILEGPGTPQENAITFRAERIRLGRRTEQQSQ